MYAAGEELFALRSTQHPELVKIKKEACLLDQLYGLYMDVIHTLERCDKDPDLSIRAMYWRYTVVSCSRLPHIKFHNVHRATKSKEGRIG